ncbi:MAG: hypothetical protein ACJA2W_000478 [Planctomycetota bacterium]|jgi:hypothetical protein
MAALVVASCAPTRVHLSTDAPQVKQLFVVAGGFGTLRPIFEEGNSRTLGDFAQNLPSGTYDHATFRLADADDSANVWKVVTSPKTDWLDYKVSRLGDEVTVVVNKSGFKKRPDMCLGFVVLSDGATSGQRYFGTLIDTIDIEPSGFSIFKSGPSIRVALQGDGSPVWNKTD